MRIASGILFFCLFLISLSGQSQDKPNTLFVGKVYNKITNAPLSGITVEVSKNGSVIQTVSTGSNGKFKLKPLDIDQKYVITFKGSGYITRYVDVDLNGIPASHYPAGGWEVPFDMGMVPEIPEVNYSPIQNKPTAFFKYNAKEDYILYDEKVSNSYNNELDKVLKAIQEKQKGADEKEKKFQQLVTEGDNSVKGKDYQTAINKYTEALAIKDDPAVKSKLTDAQAKYDEAEKGKGLDKKYAEFITAADNAYKGKDYANALANYKEALKLKPTEKIPQDKIKEIELLIAAELKKDEDYAKAINEGNKLFDAKNYDEAIKQYEVAQKLKPTETQPRDLIEKAKNAKNAGAAKEKEFADLVKKGDDYVVKKSFADAITSYEAALAIKQDAGVQAKLDKAKADKLEAEKASQTEKEYQAKMDEADKAFGESKWDQSISLYEAASKIKPTEKKPKDQIIIAQQKKADEAKNAALNKDYNDLMKKGEVALNASKYDEAITAYEAAGKLKPTEQEPKDQLALARQKKLDAEKNAEREKQYQTLMTQAETEFKAKTWDKAITTYEAALKIKPDEQKPKDQIELARKNKQDELDVADKQKRAKDLVVKGDAAMPGKKYDEAIDYYQQSIDLVNDPATQKKLDAAKEAKKAEELANKEKETKEKQYNDLVAEADNLFSNSNWEKSIEKYKAALVIKPTEKHPTAQIILAQQKIEADKKNAELNKKYADLMAQGETEMTAKTWDKAIATYEAAAKLKPEEEKPKDQIALARQKKQEEADAAGLLKKVNDLIAKGDAQMPLKKYDDAINFYQQAYDLKSDPEIQKKIDAARKAKEDELAAQQSAAEKEARYKALIAEADQEFSSSNWKAAIDKYESALKIKDKEKYPTDRIALAQQKIAAEQASEADKLAKYKAAMDLGLKDYSSGDFDKSIKNFEIALTFKPGDEKALEYIDKANKEKEAKMATYKKMYDDMIKQADKDFNAGNYADAKGYYTRASNIFSNEKYPKDQLIEIDKKLAEQKDYADKKAKYDELIKKADAEFKANSFDASILSYEGALKILTDEQYPKDQIEKAKIKKQEQAEQKDYAAKKAKYDEIIKKADAELAANKFDASIILYESALKVLDEQYPKDQIEKARAKKDELANQAAMQAQLDAEYKELIKQADEAFKSKDYDNALNYYTDAKGKKPNEVYPKDQITKINALKGDLAKQEEIRKKYQAKIDAADALFNSDKFEESKKVYAEAAAIKADETYPQEMIDKANTRLKEISQGEMRKQYDMLIAQADKDFNAGNYADAKGYYERASKMFANDPHPKNRIIEIDKILANEKANADKKVQYETIVKRADKELKANDFDKSIASYNEALKIFPSEQYPQDQIAEANRRKAEYLANQGAKQRYQEAMTKGMTHFNAGTFDAAIVNFEQALQAIPNDAEATRMKAKAEDELRKKMEFYDQQYNAIIRSADENFNDKKLTEAKELYQRALKFKPNEQYPKDQLEKISQLEGNRVEANNYNVVIAEANKLFNAKNYSAARDKYVEASNLMPAIDFPKARIKEIDKILGSGNNSTTLNGTLPTNEPQNGPVVKEKFYGTEISISAEEAQKVMLKARMDDEVGKGEKTYQDKLDQENLLAVSNETAEEKRLRNEEEFKSQKNQQDSYNDKGEQNRQDNVSSYANLKEERYNAEGTLSHDRNDFLIRESQKLDQIKIEFVYNAVGTDEIRQQNVKNTAEFKEERYNAESKLEGQTEQKRYDHATQLREDNFRLQDQMASMDTMRINNANQMADFKENRYVAESALEGNTDEKRLERANQLRDNNWALQDQMASADTMRVNNANDLARFKEDRYNAESQLEGETEEKRYNRANELRDDNFRLQDQFGSMDTMRVNNANDLAQFKENRYNAESQLEGETEEKRYARANELRDDNFKLQDQLGSMDTMRINNANQMAKYKENRYVAESALEGDTDEKRLARANELRDNNYALQDQLATIDTMRFNNANDLAVYKEKRYESEEELADKNKEKIYAKKDSLDAQKIRAEEKAAQLNTMADVNFKELKQQEDERNKTNEEISANSDTKRSNNQADLENQKYRELHPTSKDKAVLVSEKSFQRNGPDGKPMEITIQKMIKKGNTTYEYLMIVNKQGNSYFKNGAPISETQWSVETAVDKE